MKKYTGRHSQLTAKLRVLSSKTNYPYCHAVITSYSGISVSSVHFRIVTSLHDG